MISTSEHHWLLIMKQTPPPLLFPNSFARSWRWMETPSDRVQYRTVDQVYMKTMTLQCLVSHWKANLLLSSSSLLSSDWRFARRMLGKGGRFSHFLCLTRTPACDPCFLHLLRFPGVATGTPSHGYSPLFVDHGEKVLSTNCLMYRSCSLSYCMIGLACVVCMLWKSKWQIKTNKKEKLRRSSRHGNRSQCHLLNWRNASTAMTRLPWNMLLIFKVSKGQILIVSMTPWSTNYVYKAWAWKKIPTKYHIIRHKY